MQRRRLKASSFKFAPFSKRQKQVLHWWRPGSPYADYDGIIAEGSIRSGKTIVYILSFILWTTHTFTGRNFIISGRTVGSLKRNVISPMLRILRALKIEYTYNRSDNQIEFGGNIYYLFGADNDASQDKIQGLDAAGWLADEVALHHPDFIAQALGRLVNTDNAKFWWNCNPESPFHTVYTDYILCAKDKRILHLHFTLDDNLTLSQKAKDKARRMFSGVFFKRYILGLWVVAEGAIFDMFDEDRHIVDESKLPSMIKYWVGVDYGTGSVTCFWLLGLGSDNRLYFVDRWRWDAKLKQRQLSDPDLADALDNWLDGLGVTPETIVIPGDAQSFVVYLQKYKKKAKRIKSLAWANRSPGSVITGIRDVSSLLALDLLFFSRKIAEYDRGLEEFRGYVWDSKAQQRGDDKPLKENDHDPDSIRYVVEYAKKIWRKWIDATPSKQYELAA